MWAEPPEKLVSILAAAGYPVPLPKLSAVELREHRFMLADETRVTRFLDAIAATVRPGDVVVDLGCGSGVLSVAAARAGASRVYAIERSAMADIARAVIEANGVARRVTVTRANALDVTLPERADVVIAELIGADPWSERLLDVLAHANRHLRKADGRIVPASIAMVMVPLEMPRDALLYLRATDDELRRWRDRYGIDLSAVAHPPAAEAPALFPRKDMLSWAVGDAARAHAVETRTVDAPKLHAEIDLRCTRDASVNAVAIGFEVEVATGVRISSIDEETSWDLSARALVEPVGVRAGDTINVTYDLDGTDVRLSCSSR